MADLWHAPEPADVIGCSTTGSSEACMLAGMALKRRWAAGQPPGAAARVLRVCSVVGALLVGHRWETLSLVGYRWQVP